MKLDRVTRQWRLPAIMTAAAPYKRSPKIQKSKNPTTINRAVIEALRRAQEAEKLRMSPVLGQVKIKYLIISSGDTKVRYLEALEKNSKRSNSNSNSNSNIDDLGECKQRQPKKKRKTTIIYCRVGGAHDIFNFFCLLLC